MKNKVAYFLRCIIGVFLKTIINVAFFFRIPPGKLNYKNNIAVSLTSYGRRVSSTLPYTLYYLLLQKVKPSKIYLWLDNVNWNENNIPWKLKFLVNQGIEIKFCKDIRSYKKLVYALPLCTNTPIVTIDDDVIYSRSLIKDFMFLHKNHPNSVISFRYRQPKWNEKGKTLLPYSQWSQAFNAPKTTSPLPIGVGGILYPPGCFNDDVFNESVFMQLCPKADDIWFWAMETMNGTKILGYNKMMFYPFDFFYQKIHRGASLYDSNVGSSENDNQIKAVLDYYSLWGEL